MSIISSPNTVLANCLENTLDILKPRIEINQPKEIIFSVGTQINGIPHIGTYIVQCASFIIARQVQDMFGIKTCVEFGALDNAPYDTVRSMSGYIYQRNYCDALGKEELQRLVDLYYTSYFGKLQELTEIPYVTRLYSDTQGSPNFRKNFLKTLKFIEKIKWCVSPSHGNLRIRIPCPKCHYSEKYAESVKLMHFNEESVLFQCACLNHGLYEVEVKVNDDLKVYLDLNTLYRNVVKESMCADRGDKLYVMIKGGDWVFSTQTVDWALGVMGYSPVQIPVRIFTPQIVTETGAKLSKSLIREGDITLTDIPEWILDMDVFAKTNSDYVKYIVWLVKQFLSHPRHMYRSYTYQEIIRILNHKKGGTDNEEFKW